MRMRQRSFIQTSLVAGATMAVPHLIAEMALSSSGSGSPNLPWRREILLRDVAKAVNLQSTLSAENPLPSYGGESDSGFAVEIYNLKMRTPPSSIRSTILHPRIRTSLREAYPR
jgi:hypothetical protein